MRIGETLREIRKNKKLTLKELSKKTNVTITFLSDIENNKKRPSIETLEKISKALEVPMYYFLNDNPLYYSTQITNRITDVKSDDFLLQARTLFMGDKLSNKDKEVMFRDITDLYWASKELDK